MCWPVYGWSCRVLLKCVQLANIATELLKLVPTLTKVKHTTTEVLATVSVNSGVDGVGSWTTPSTLTHPSLAAELV